VGAKLLHAERQTKVRTVMTKLIVDFRKFANAPKMLRLKNICDKTVVTKACAYCSVLFFAFFYH
jgi:hypothetical protein